MIILCGINNVEDWKCHPEEFRITSCASALSKVTLASLPAPRSPLHHVEELRHGADDQLLQRLQDHQDCRIQNENIMKYKGWRMGNTKDNGDKMKDK